MCDFTIPIPAPGVFRDIAFSHGWLRLPPYHWDEARETLTRTERLPHGRLLRVELSAAPGAVRVRSAAPPGLRGILEPRVRWILALDEELDAFHALCAAEPGLRDAGARGQGRILRCPTVWEDLVKTLFSVNTTWRQTVRMTARLVERYGPGEPGFRAFPEPEAIAAVPPGVLQEECRIGYRAEALAALARAAADGRLDLEGLKEPSLAAEEVEARLRALRGIGPYAAANVLMLLGHYDHLPVDSWFRKTVRDAWFGGRPAPDRELVAAFERFRPFRTLVYRFYDWEGTMRREVWG